MQGPEWLPDKERWPKWQPVNTLHLQAADIDTTDVCPITEPMTSVSTGIHTVIDMHRYSRLNTLLAVTVFSDSATM